MSEKRSDSAKLNPSSLTLIEAAKLFSKAGGHTITVEMLEKDLRDGAPVNPDGTLNLVHFCAWQAREDLRAH